MLSPKALWVSSEQRGFGSLVIQELQEVTFQAMFNVMYGLMMCSLNFSEHVGHRLAARYPYVFRDEFAINTKGLNEYEKNELQVALRESVGTKLKYTDPQKWR